MTRYAIDAAVALRLVRAESGADEPHQLVGPSVLRSHALSILFRDVREGRLDEQTGREQLEGLAGLKIRLLGDRVSRSTAWKIARQLGWDDTATAEYLAVAVLQADALVTEDERLSAGAQVVILTMSATSMDASINTAWMFWFTCRACSATLSGTVPSLRTPTCPEMKSRRAGPSTSAPWLYRGVAGMLGGLIGLNTWSLW